MPMLDAVRPRRCLLTVMLAFALVACGPRTASSQQRLSVPTNRILAPGIAMNALITGRLSGRTDPQHARACLWIAEGQDRAVLLWPSGYWAENNPLRILNQSGKVIGRVGDQVSLGGGFAEINSGNADLRACGEPTPTHGWIVAPGGG